MNPNRKTRSPLRIAFVGVLSLLLCCSFAVAQDIQPTQVSPNKEVATATATVSGSSVFFADQIGTESNVFEFSVSGGPSTLTISVYGCGASAASCTSTPLASSTAAAILSIAPGNFWIGGSVTSGAFVPGENLLQTTSGATATLVGNPSGSTPMVVVGLAGPADALLGWVGQTSGAIFTPSGSGGNPQPATGPYPRYQVVVSWTGGTSPSVTINRTGTTS
jgi:hypothetical protein